MVLAAPMAGFTAYAASKAAVRTFADCLRSELLGTGVTVSIGYPPDTQTPGYEQENITKPAETEAVSRAMADSVYTADQVAATFFRGMKRRQYHLPSPDFLQQLGLSLIAGPSPRPLNLVSEVLLAPVLLLVAAAMRRVQDQTVLRCRQQHASASLQRSQPRSARAAANGTKES